MSEPSQELEGTTLAIYLFAVRFDRPIGTRDVVRNVGVSSPSVAYRHLQRLTALDLLAQTESGEYVVKTKIHLRGYLWLGKRLVHRTAMFGLLFTAALVVEVAVLLVHLGVEDYEFMTFFVLLTVITAAAMTLFLAEFVLRHMKRRKQPHPTPKQT